MRELSVRFN